MKKTVYLVDLGWLLVIGKDEDAEIYANVQNQRGDDYNLFNSCDVKKIDEKYGEVYLGWNWVKWYTDEFDDVYAVMYGLRKVKEADFSYQFARIGESEDDIERDEHFNRDEELSRYIWISRTFED